MQPDPSTSDEPIHSRTAGRTGKPFANVSGVQCCLSATIQHGADRAAEARLAGQEQRNVRQALRTIRRHHSGSTVHAFVYLQTCAVAAFVNVRVATITAVVFPIISCAPLESMSK